MLSPKPWKADAILRLVISIFICVYAGSLLLVVLQYRPSSTLAGIGLYSLSLVTLGCLGATLYFLRRRWQIETLLRGLLPLLCFFYAGLVLGVLVQRIAGQPGPSVIQIVVGGVSFQGAAIALVALFLREHGSAWGEAFGFFHDWTVAVMVGVAVACIFLPIGIGLQRLSAKGLQYLLHVKPEEQVAVQTLQKAVTWRDWAASAVVIVGLVPPAEEMLFRGILYPFLKRTGFPRLALWGSALLFALVHFNLVSFVSLTVLAAVLTVLYERTDNLLAPISAHAMFNAFNLVLLYLFQR